MTMMMPFGVDETRRQGKESKGRRWQAAKFVVYKALGVVLPQAEHSHRVSTFTYNLPSHCAMHSLSHQQYVEHPGRLIST